MTSIILRALKPFMAVIPKVNKPKKDVSLKKKILLTFSVLILYGVMTSIPIYVIGGFQPRQEATSITILRTTIASHQGTLFELGIGHILTSFSIMQFLVGIKLIKIDKSNPMDRDLFIAAQKVIAVVLTIPMGLTLIFGGNYGQNLGNKAIIFILIQLLVVGILVILMDEMIQKG